MTYQHMLLISMSKENDSTPGTSKEHLVVVASNICIICSASYI